MKYQDINLIPPEELGNGSNIKLNVCEHEVDMYWKVAIEVLEVIAENNRKGEPTVMIVPYGPLGPYARIAELVNKYRISLKKCVFINMDEYLNEDLTYIDYNHPLSFRGGMDRTFYSKVDEELNVLPENRIFPEPGNEGRIMEIIEKYGKLDMAFGGVGINGHYAFNEPPEAGEKVTPEEFAEIRIPGAVNVPNEEIGTDEIPELPDKEQLILVYCRSGNRSKQASEKLANLGYSNVYEFGGIIDWPGETVSGN